MTVYKQERSFNMNDANNNKKNESLNMIQTLKRRRIEFIDHFIIFVNFLLTLL